jgi:hypothetical protein
LSGAGAGVIGASTFGKLVSSNVGARPVAAHSAEPPPGPKSASPVWTVDDGRFESILTEELDDSV